MLASRAISGFPNTIQRLDAARFSAVRKAAGTLPRYVDYAGQVTFPGEIELNQTRMWAFLLEGDQAKMTAWCQALFDTPSHSAVQVLPLYHAGGVASPLVLIVGLGKRDEFDVGAAFRAAGTAGRGLPRGDIYAPQLVARKRIECPGEAGAGLAGQVNLNRVHGLGEGCD